MILRPSKDSQRVLIGLQVDAYMAGTPDPSLVSHLSRGFGAALAAFRTHLSAQRNCQAVEKTRKAEAASADANLDEALRVLAAHTQMKHGISGLRKLESHWGNMPRTDLVNLPRAEQARHVSDFLMRYDAGIDIPLSADLVKDVRDALAAVQAALVAENQAVSARRYATKELVASRKVFDSEWVDFARGAQSVLGDGSSVLVPDLSVAKKARGEEEEETDDEEEESGG